MATPQKRVCVTASAVLLAAAVAGCGKGGGAPPGAGGPPGTPVKAVAAIAEDVPVYIDEIGKTSATETVTVQPQVSGQIVDRPFRDGADLKKGQVLFKIDPRPFQATLEQAQGQLKKDEAAKASADWNVGQDTAALSQKAISEQQMHTDTAARDTAAGAIAVDHAMIDQAKLNLEYATITSPIDGRAGERLVDVGNVVNGAGQAAGTSLLVINKVDPIYADFTVTEAELQRVQGFMAGGTLSVEVLTPADAALAEAPPPDPAAAAPGQASADDKSVAMENRPTSRPVAFQPRVGKLIFLDNTVQDASGTVRLRAELPNGDHHFWPGQFVRVRLVLETKRSVLVPNIATQISQQGLFVFKILPDEKSPTKMAVVPQPVTVGQRHGDLVVIKTGLNAGDQVVTVGQMMLQPGAAIMVMGGGPPGAMPPAGPAKADPKLLKSPGTDNASKGGPSASAAPVPGRPPVTASEGRHS